MGRKRCASLCSRMSRKVNKMVLLDGGYHHGKMNADYFAKLYKNAKEGECPPRSLEEEIIHYEKDFDEYIFDSKEAFIQSEKWFTAGGLH